MVVGPEGVTAGHAVGGGRLQDEVSRSEDTDRELSTLRAKHLKGEATRLRSRHDEAHSDAKHLHEERSRLQQDLREASSGSRKRN